MLNFLGSELGVIYLPNFGLRVSSEKINRCFLKEVVDNRSALQLPLYKLEVIPALEHSNKSIEFLFETKVDMMITSNTLAFMLLYLQNDAKVMRDYSNMFIHYEKDDNGEWEEIDEYPEED